MKKYYRRRKCISIYIHHILVFIGPGKFKDDLKIILHISMVVINYILIKLVLEISK